MDQGMKKGKEKKVTESTEKDTVKQRNHTDNEEGVKAT